MLENFLKENKFKKFKSFYYGTYKEYIVSVSFKAAYVIVNVSFSYPINPDIAKQVSKDLSIVKSKYASLQVGAVSAGFVELTLYQEEKLDSNIFGILDQTIDVLIKNNVRHDKVCAFCGKTIEENEVFIKVKKTVLSVHKNCIEEAEKHAKELKDKLENKGKNNHFLVTILSLIVSACIIGLMFLLGLNDSIFLVTPLAGVICSFILKTIFIKLKVKLNLTNVIIQLSFSVLCLLGSVYFGYSSFYANSIENLSFLNALKLFITITINNDMFKLLLPTLGCGLFLIAINSLNDFRYLNNMDSTVQKLS